MTEYIEQTADDLRFYLLTESVDETQFLILGEQRLEWGDYEVTLNILGESHLVTVAGNSGFLQEICACTDVSAPESVIITGGMLHDLPGSFAHRSGALGYAFHQQSGLISEHTDHLATLQALPLTKPTCTAAYTFSTHPSHGPHEPVTIVNAEVEHTLTIRTLHTYPNEDRFMFTKSTFTEIDIF